VSSRETNILVLALFQIIISLADFKAELLLIATIGKLFVRLTGDKATI
jgi:hypothetical protein